MTIFRNIFNNLILDKESFHSINRQEIRLSNRIGPYDCTSVKCIYTYYLMVCDPSSLANSKSGHF